MNTHRVIGAKVQNEIHSEQRRKVKLEILKQNSVNLWSLQLVLSLISLESGDPRCSHLHTNLVDSLSKDLLQVN